MVKNNYNKLEDKIQSFSNKGVKMEKEKKSLVEKFKEVSKKKKITAIIIFLIIIIIICSIIFSSNNNSSNNSNAQQAVT